MGRLGAGIVRGNLRLPRLHLCQQGGHATLGAARVLRALHAGDGSRVGAARLCQAAHRQAAMCARAPPQLCAVKAGVRRQRTCTALPVCCDAAQRLSGCPPQSECFCAATCPSRPPVALHRDCTRWRRGPQRALVWSAGRLPRQPGQLRAPRPHLSFVGQTPLQCTFQATTQCSQTMLLRCSGAPGAACVTHWLARRSCSSG